MQPRFHCNCNSLPPVSCKIKQFILISQLGCQVLICFHSTSTSLLSISRFRSLSSRNRLMDENKSIVEISSQGSGTRSENSRNSVNGVVLDTVMVTNSVETSSVSKDEDDSGSKIDEAKSSKPLVDSPGMAVNHETCSGRGIAEHSSDLVDGVKLGSVILVESEQSTTFSGEKEMGSSDVFVEAPDMENGQRQRFGEGIGQIDQVLETAVTVNLDQTAACVHGANKEFEAKNNQLGSGKTLVEGLMRKESKVENDFCVIDMRCGGTGGGDEKGIKKSLDEERVCRICHLNSEQSLDSTSTATTTATTSSSTLDLIKLGCGCKGELGIAHRHCAEAWFELKGNRLCEICGRTAKNITGVGDFRFMEEWNEQRYISRSNGSAERSGCLRGQPFCNFLMACLVVAFILPWFFRVNVF